VVRGSIQSIARWLQVGFALVLVCMAIFIPFLPEGYSTPRAPRSAVEWFEQVFAIVACVVIFSPYFLGAAALNDARRHLGQDPTRESVPNFLALYFWPFGGLIHVHRRVREVLHAA
jgi:hypothetical protein